MKFGSEFCFLVSTLEPKNKLINLGIKNCEWFSKYVCNKNWKSNFSDYYPKNFIIEKLFLIINLDNTLAKNADTKILLDKRRNLPLTISRIMAKIASTIAKILQFKDRKLLVKFISQALIRSMITIYWLNFR